MATDKITRHHFDAARAAYPLPPEVGELLDAAGADREGFQHVIRAAQPFVPMLQRTECVVLAMNFIEAAQAASTAIDRARA